jgi:Zn-dependent peptidase ImmA (M78 family)/transcriptional regulator with XRE-family HTH domain
MPNNREFVALALRNARENCGLSQQAAADQIGLSRTVVAQIELGNRLVLPDELSKLAALYRRPPEEFSADVEPSENDVLSIVLRMGLWVDDRRARTRLQAVLSLCREAIALERSLARAPRTGPPHYDLAAPRNAAEAISQGEQVASQERQRLGWGTTLAIGNVPDLIMTQGIRVAARDFNDEVIGLFVSHASVGLVVIVSGKGRVSRARFGLLHGYAHALFERSRAVVVTTPLTSEELVEIRADAFATAFLLPPAGLVAAVTRLDKGRPSRRAHTVFGLGTRDPIQAEIRSTPGSQALTYHDVASIARRFGTNYRAVVYRLSALDIISKPESAELLRKKQQRLAREYGSLFTTKVTRERRQPSGTEGDLELRAEIAYLAIEAYRRRVIDKTALAAFVPKLQIAELSEARFLEFAESVR